MTEFQTKLVEIYCRSIVPNFDLDTLKETVAHAVSVGKIMIVYYAQLGESGGIDEVNHRPFYRIANKEDRCCLISLSHLFGRKDEHGLVNVQNDSYEGEDENDDEGIDYTLEIGDKRNANHMYFFSILPMFDFDP